MTSIHSLSTKGVRSLCHNHIMLSGWNWLFTLYSSPSALPLGQSPKLLGVFTPCALIRSAYRTHMSPMHLRTGQSRDWDGHGEPGDGGREGGSAHQGYVASCGTSP